ncbi:MAG: dihydroorotase [Burkholderiaceae bacterium]
MNSETTLHIRQPDDLHLHLRDGAALVHTVGATAAQFARAIVMPNLKPPVTTVAQALAYRERILRALAPNQSFTPLMTLYLTEETPVAEIEAAAASGFIHGVKLYPSGATTNSAAGVRDVRNCRGVFETMQRLGMPLLIHGEVTDPAVDVFDREAVFIDEVLMPLRQDFPALRIVFEHITTMQAAQYVRDCSTRDATGRLLLGATLTPQHLLYNRNALFAGGLQPHWYCLPVLKREAHRQALLEVATSGLPQFFLGTDSAPHTQAAKEMACGCAGCYSAPIALELYAEAFGSVGRLDRLENFASQYGAEFYGLPLNEGRLELVNVAQTVPVDLPFVDGRIVPLCAGRHLSWQARKFLR